jgi:metal-responsive CopG/Arc/MetJ family transcriptional regulator
MRSNTGGNWANYPRFSVSMPRELLDRMDAYLAKRPVFQSRAQYLIHLVLEDLDNEVVERFDKFVNESLHFRSRNEAILHIISKYLDENE